MDTFTTPNSVRGISVPFYDMQSVLWNNISSTPSSAYGRGQLPQEMQFTSVNVIVIVIYSNLVWISLLGNITVFSTLIRMKKKTRVHILLLNLCTADIMVTVVEMPLKIAWKWTVQWTAGNWTCKLFSCLRVFGLYLSALLLIAMSVDRFLAIWDPMSSVQKAGQRTRIMILLAWLLAIACAAPQALIFHVLQHPEYNWYHQCVTFGSFASRNSEMAYGIGVMLLTYGLPLLTILMCYLGIWLRVVASTIQHRRSPTDTYVTDSFRNGTESLRRSMVSLRTSNTDRLIKAKHRTLKMTVFIVGIFILCWSPYQLLSMWYIFDRNSAAQLDHLVQEILFIFGVSSSVLNPYVYGLYSMGIWRHVNLFMHIPCLRKTFMATNPGFHERDTSFCGRTGDAPPTRYRGRYRTTKFRASIYSNASLNTCTSIRNSFKRYRSSP
ncbi:hypothetical protein RvY_15579 [Ramazzottius varieornatus]|uniref:G-protein coupled receptors family 1 profile domain-containing protein n=1 Tax=Ramazzottius varieornatus TaxID=947166 RepID=A0A1D1VWZ4_RAMVA|nr:hypothetical protein RvY_15579 [Ramazzottius varieornatus]